MRRKSHVRFWSGGGVGDRPADRNPPSECAGHAAGGGRLNGATAVNPRPLCILYNGWQKLDTRKAEVKVLWHSTVQYSSPL